MPDNNTDNPVAALSVLNITQDEILHVDESGHLQVEISPLGYEIGCAPRDRVQQIVAQDLWDAFYELARGKSDEWLITIAKLVAENNKCATYRLLKLVLMVSSLVCQSRNLPALYSCVHGAQRSCFIESNY